jgi:hypothetical protein
VLERKLASLGGRVHEMVSSALVRTNDPERQADGGRISYLSGGGEVALFAGVMGRLCLGA